MRGPPIVEDPDICYPNLPLERNDLFFQFLRDAWLAVACRYESSLGIAPSEENCFAQGCSSFFLSHWCDGVKVWPFHLLCGLFEGPSLFQSSPKGWLILSLIRLSSPPFIGVDPKSSLVKVLHASFCFFSRELNLQYHHLPSLLKLVIWKTPKFFSFRLYPSYPPYPIKNQDFFLRSSCHHHNQSPHHPSSKYFGHC